MSSHTRNLLILIVVIGGDIFTKILFYNQQFLANTLLLSPQFNPGIAWSLPVPLWAIITMSIVALGVLGFVYYKKKMAGRIIAIIIGGIIGNMYDRLFLHGVRDFIDFGFRPVFNVADMAITIGITLLIIQEYSPGKNKPKQ